MTVGEHLEELRARVLSSIMALFGVLVICLLDQNFYMNIILKPHINAMKALNLKATIQVLRYEESFFSHLKIAITAGLILTMPFILYQIWLFVSVGLKESEKKYVRFIFPFTLIFFITGVLFGYFILIPLGLRFLGSYGSVNIHVGFTLSSYISLFFILTFVSGIIFELPLVMLILVKLNILSSYFYTKLAILCTYSFCNFCSPHSSRCCNTASYGRTYYTPIFFRYSCMSIFRKIFPS